MGSWCVVCAISGVPIRPGDEVVGWKSRKAPYEHNYIPTSLPVVGKYDDYGGIEDAEGKILIEGDGMVVICHRKMWDEQIKRFDHKDFGGKPCPSLSDEWAHLRLKFAEETALSQRLLASFTPTGADAEYWKNRANPFTVAYGVLNRSSSGVSFAWYFSKFTLGVNGKVNTDKMSYEERAKIPQEDISGTFEKILLNGIINGFPDDTLVMLEGMIKIYATAIFRCRPILPDQMCRCVQYPDGRKENGWLSAVHKFATKELPAKRKKA
jgi:hypothetical protein